MVRQAGARYRVDGRDLQWDRQPGASAAGCPEHAIPTEEDIQVSRPARVAWLRACQCRVVVGYPGSRARAACRRLAAESGDLLAILMIETTEGLKNADAIAAVPGVGTIFVGAGADLSQYLGVERNSPELGQGFKPF